MSKPGIPSEQGNKDLLELAVRVELCFHDIMAGFNRRQLKLFDLPAHQRIFLFILTRSLKTLSSILILCREGYGQDAAPLLRTFLENLVTVEYILRDPAEADQLTKRFVSYKWVILRRHLQEEELEVDQNDPRAVKRFSDRKLVILKKAEDFKKDFRVSSDRALLTWSGKTVRDMARLADHELLGEYERTFRMCSRFSHPGVLGDKEYVVQGGGRLLFSPLPSEIGVRVQLLGLVRYAYRFLSLSNRLFAFNIDQRLELIHKDILVAKAVDLLSPTGGAESDQSIDNSLIRQSIVEFRID